MSLSSAINTAQTIFNHTGLQTASVAQNIANASNPDYSRRSGVLTIDATGAQILKIERAYDNGLVKQTMIATSDSAAQGTLQEKLQRMRSLLGGNDYETSPSTYISILRNNLQAYATKPNESTLAATVVSSAQDAANSLNNISTEIQRMRGDIDQEIKNLVTDLNSLLDRFQEINDAIRKGTATGKDVNNELDMRERYLKQISEIVGVRSFTRGDNDMVLYTTDGTMLFDGTKRDILFMPTPAFDAGTTGNPIIIDGVPVKAGENGNTTAKGQLAALLQVRDSVVPTYQAQLDETARGLIELFAQYDITGASTDTIPGLFTWRDYDPAVGIPAAGTVVPGLAAQIKVNDNLVKNKGGDPVLLRDGGYDVNNLGIADPVYLANTNGDASYSLLLDSYVARFEIDQDFDAVTKLDTSTTIADFATGSVGWLEQLISESANANENKSAQLTRVSEALSNTTGVSLDEEMSLMLDLEQSYKASTKIVQAVDEMLQSLLAIVD